MTHFATATRLAYLGFAAVLLCFVGNTTLLAAESDKLDPKTAAAGKLELLPGFKAEMIYKVPREEKGSWVSLTVDPQGRLIASSQLKRMFRITPPAPGSGKMAEVEKIDLRIGQAQGLLYAFDSLYVVLNGGGVEGSGLYRVRDTNRDDVYDEVKLLRRIHGQGEHGPHGIVLSPDGKSLYIAGGNFTKIPDPEKSLVPRHWDEDLILNRQGDSRGFGVGLRAPGGWVARTDPDGKEWELVCTGFRNQYDIAFNEEGELFTYDADMEWDIGTPWYRPTRVNHVVSGGEFGWRTGTGKWPSYQPDSLPASVDIGPGSPTGVVFGTGAKFPAKYQKAYYVCDWSYGNLYAVHLTPDGASYKGTFEPFVAAAPLPVTDVVVHPHDGMLYFTVGGRGVESAIYRVWYEGDESTEPVQPAADAGTELRQLRHKLEAFHGRAKAGAVDFAFPYLSHDDRFIRFAARIALEHQPVAEWQDRVLAEKNPTAQLTGLIGLARSAGKNEDGKLDALREKMLTALDQHDWSQLSEEDRLALVRAYQLTLIRLGRPDADRQAKLVTRLGAFYPAATEALNRELCGLMIYFQAPDAATKTLALLKDAQTQEEQIQFALSLRLLKTGWTLDQRREYFNWFEQARQFAGGASFEGFTSQIRKEAIELLPEDVKKELGDLVADKPVKDETPVGPPREFVKKWEVDEIVAAADVAGKTYDFSHGQRVFAEASCFKCHRVAGRGGTIGPDLTGVGRRFSVRDLAEAVVDPNKVISDQYRATVFLMEDGRTVSGHIANMGGGNLSVMTDMLKPSNFTDISRSDIEEMMPSPTSMMPTGLVDHFTSEEIADLLAYLRSGGDANHALFGKAAENAAKSEEDADEGKTTSASVHHQRGFRRRALRRSRR